MRSAYWTELAWRATTLPVKMTRPSLPKRSILSASMVRGWLRSSFALAPARAGAWPPAGAAARGGGPAGGGRAGAGGRWGAGSRPPPGERRAHPALERGDLVAHPHVERGAVHDGAFARQADRRVRPDPALLAPPAQHARLQAHAVT